MKNYFKYSMLITLVILITASLVNVQAAPAIGTTTQPHPYESNPTATANFMVGGPTLAGKGAMIDGDLTSSGDFYLGAPHILRPESDGTYTSWTGDVYRWKEETADGDSSYVSWAGVTATKESSYLEDMPADASGTISSVKVYIVARRAATATVTERDQVRIIMRTTADIFSGYLIATDADYTAYAPYSFSSATRPQGGSWTWADVNNLQAGVDYYKRGSVSTEIRVTQLYVEVSGPTKGYFEFNTFDSSPDTSFSIGFVDIKIKYNVPTALSDDKYNITYTTGTTWNTLQADTGDAYDRDASPATRPWSQKAEPTDGTWSWTDIGNLRIRVGVTATGAWDNQKMYIFEVWASVYPLPLPPSGGTPAAHLAVIPSAIYKVEAAQYIFVDIYVTGVSAMGGIDFTMLFDTSILTATDAWIYDPFQYVNTAPLTLDNTNGWVIFAQYMPTGEGVGFTGSEPIARIYFTVNQWGMSKLNIQNATESGPKATAMYTVTGPSIPYVDHDGWVSAPHYLSAVDGSDHPTTFDISWPTVNKTKWYELYPTYSKKWTLTSLQDNGDGVLSYSDQIDMLNATNYRYWFHVDAVTITIHWSNMSTGEYGAAEAVPPTTTLPLGDPTYTMWHVIYPATNFSKTITITSWIDSNPGGTFNPSDHFDFTYSDSPDVTHWAHLDYVSHDILVSEKPIPPEYVSLPPVPEFPLGTEIIMILAPIITIIYLWRIRKNKQKPPTTQLNLKG